jgi:hypothetical protein
MFRQRTEKAGEIWLRCANPRCGWEEFEYLREKSAKEKEIKERKTTPSFGAPVQKCPRCRARMQPMGTMFMCQSCGKIVKG